MLLVKCTTYQKLKFSPFFFRLFSFSMFPFWNFERDNEWLSQGFLFRNSCLLFFWLSSIWSNILCFSLIKILGFKKHPNQQLSPCWSNCQISQPHKCQSRASRSPFIGHKGIQASKEKPLLCQWTEQRTGKTDVTWTMTQKPCYLLYRI